MTPERLRVELQSSMNGNDLLTAESLKYRKRAEEAEGGIDRFFEYLSYSFNIESREEIEKDCKESWAEGTNPLEVALHFIWKRKPQVTALEADIAQLEVQLGVERDRVTELEVDLCRQEVAIEELENNHAIAIAALEAKLLAYQWIHVKDGLPEISGILQLSETVEVLYLNNENEDDTDVASGYYDYLVKNWKPGRLNAVTHWRHIHLPGQAPEQKKERAK
jgi:hypothetical protein